MKLSEKIDNVVGIMPLNSPDGSTYYVVRDELYHVVPCTTCN